MQFTFFDNLAKAGHVDPKTGRWVQSAQAIEAQKNQPEAIKELQRKQANANTRAEHDALLKEYYDDPVNRARTAQTIADMRGMSLEDSARANEVQDKFGRRIFDLSTGGPRKLNAMGGIFGLSGETPENIAYRNKLQKWQEGFDENFDNPFIQGGNFVTEHYSSDRKLAEMLRDAKVGDPIPTLSRAEFL